MTHVGAASITVGCIASIRFVPAGNEEKQAASSLARWSWCDSSDVKHPLLVLLGSAYWQYRHGKLWGGQNNTLTSA